MTAAQLFTSFSLDIMRGTYIQYTQGVILGDPASKEGEIMGICKESKMEYYSHYILSALPTTLNPIG